MRDSWIDQDEFDKLVGAFSNPKKRRRQPPSRRAKAQGNKEAPVPVSASGEVLAENSTEEEATSPVALPDVTIFEIDDDEIDEID